jgi:platelet-activating factor acetylhydrolase IB subunit beta/gamma
MAGLTGNIFALEYPYAPYNEGKMDPQKNGWPLTQAEKDYIAKPSYQRRPGKEANQHLPKMWPVTPSADSFGGPTAYSDCHEKLLKAIDQYKVENGSEVDILLVGDSITWQWCGMAGYNAYPQPFNAAWTGSFSAYKTVNIGLGGDKTQGLLWRLDHNGLGGLNPKLVILAIGHNDMFFTGETGIEAAAQGILYCLKNIREKLPQSDVLVMKILPNKSPETPFYKDAQAINTALDAMNLENDPKVHLLPDPWKDMTNTDGTLIDGLLRDGVHPSQDQGYAFLAKKIKPLVDKILKK